jgi:ubiquinone/menaquinone biosynthesis C-methylase UbiE
MSDSSDHRSTVREAFTKQASAYAANDSISDSGRIDRLVDVANPSADATVLEVATGPGYVAMGFAGRTASVVGIDLTAEPLAIAADNRTERGLQNVQFLQADAEAIPALDRAFDVVVCRYAFHHFEHPDRILAEMVRCCAQDGTIVVEDLVASEHPDRAAYQNRFERLRDPSHVRALSVGELIELFADAGLEIDATHTDAIIQEVDEWLTNAQPADDRAAEARSMIEADAEADLSGARPFWRDDTLCFVHRTATVAGRPLPA